MKKIITGLLLATALISCSMIPPEKSENFPEIDNDDLEINTEFSFNHENTESFNNPYQGFYYEFKIPLKENGADNSVDWKTYLGWNHHLYHLRFDINAFSKAGNGIKDKEISEAALNAVREILKTVEDKDKTAIVRFCYDPKYAGKYHMEASMDMMKKHAASLASVVNEFPETVAVLETGFFGAWGEMHNDSGEEAVNPDDISAIVKILLEKTRTSKIPVTVRTPKMIYDYLGLTSENFESYSFSPDKDEWRLGMFNDGYLGSDSDYGTYTISREQETAWIAKQNEHLPYGGEVINPDTNLHDAPKCFDDMKKIHLSYLNSAWNDTVISKWKDTKIRAETYNSTSYEISAYDYIASHMGYRLFAEKTHFKYDADSKYFFASVDLCNLGFGNLNRTKNAWLIFTEESKDGTEIFRTKKNVTIGNRQLKIDFAEKINIPEGNKLNVWLKISDADGKHAVQMAHKKSSSEKCWNTDLRANWIGEIELQSK